MYNKHTAAVSTGYKADRASSLQLSSVSQLCATGILMSGYGAVSRRTKRTAYASAYLAFAIKTA